MDDAVFERILVPLAGPDDADRTARALRPLIDSHETLIVSHVMQGDAAYISRSSAYDYVPGWSSVPRFSGGSAGG